MRKAIGSVVSASVFSAISALMTTINVLSPCKAYLHFITAAASKLHDPARKSRGMPSKSAAFTDQSW
jgi:hypothetical protein